MNPQQLLDNILANPDQNSETVGTLINQLLDEYHRGYPLDNLRPLLRSEDERLVDTGIWIASELGKKGKPLLSDVVPLLRHPRKRVRFFAFDCILLWAGSANKSELASAVCALNDSESIVRRRAMWFLSRASHEQLEAALAYFEPAEPHSIHVPPLQWLLSHRAADPAEVIATLKSDNPLIRKYGAAAATRMAGYNRDPLLYASTLSDSDVKEFADSSIRLL